jgi:hypothetical protein
MRLKIDDLRLSIARRFWLVGFLLLLTCHLLPVTSLGQGSTPTRFNLGGFNDLKMISTPTGNPNSGFIRVYAKTASTFCMKDYAGAETCFGGGGPATAIQYLGADPGSPANADAWINSTTGLFKERIGGATKVFYYNGVPGGVAAGDLPNCTDATTPGKCTVAPGTGISVSFGAGVATVNSTYNPLLNKQDAAAEITGDTTDLTFFTYTVPANTLGSGGCIRAQVWAQHTTGTASTVYKWYFGSTATSGSTSTSTGVYYSAVRVCNNAGVTNAQSLFQTLSSVGSTGYSALLATPAEDTTGAVILKVTFAVAATDKLTPKLFIVER